MEQNDQNSANVVDMGALTPEQTQDTQSENSQSESTELDGTELDSTGTAVTGTPAHTVDTPGTQDATQQTSEQEGDESELATDEAHVAPISYEEVLTKMALRHSQSEIDAALAQAIAFEQAQHVEAYQQWELEVVIAQAKRDDALAHNATVTAAENRAESSAESPAVNEGAETALVDVPELPQQPKIDMALRRSCYCTEYVEVDLELTTQTQAQRKEYDDAAHILRIYPATEAHSAEYIAQVQRTRFKASRARKVAQQTVIVEGMEFDADELSQQRMARALLLMNETQTTMWVLANNEVVQVNKKQLFEACKQAGEQQSALWVPAI
ncbi:hypothetical protein CWB96_19195 [Pseudoalteromonas citrea]|uniref:DUF4376 domain-containing protein n=1 Tax=Pseudoalteromonas citrea TaxID=43655 RepID=A0A5S3XJC9_9GAMM|nr:DUF4376 domain-containing protein [Pseudoalteromonas citrea]TMP46409.1 hypothetical protein CWB97_02010 [Pseudoalteromonas citrea]TMP54495.1 hypothetical protein CWB96_19195 [Pseudoalteromonas citrea]